MASWYAMLKFLKIELSGNCFAFRAVMNFLGEYYFKFGNVMRIRYLCHNHILELTNPKNQAEVHNWVGDLNPATAWSENLRL